MVTLQHQKLPWIITNKKIKRGVEKKEERENMPLTIAHNQMKERKVTKED